MSASCPFTDRVVDRPYSGGPISSSSEKKKKYCSCLAKTAAKQPKRCLPPRKAKEGLKPGCYNPYALCGRLYPRGQGRVSCVDSYDFAKMPPEQVAGVLALHGKKNVAELLQKKKMSGSKKKK